MVLKSIYNEHTRILHVFNKLCRNRMQFLVNMEQAYFKKNKE